METTVPIRPSVHYFGTPVVLLSTAMPDGRSNLTPISSAWSLGDTYVLGLGAANQGAVNLQRTGEVVLNLPDAALAANVERIAATTGADVVPLHKADRYRTEHDKWALGGFTPRPSELVGPDRVAECPVQIEARLERTVTMNAEGAIAVHVEVARVHAHPSLVVPGTDHVDLDRWRPLYYTFRHYFAQGDRVGVSFKAEQ